MHRLTFYPIGNADCCFIELDNGQNILFDYTHSKNFEDENDLRVDLKTMVSDKLEDKRKTYFDVVAFTHADEDHIKGFSDLFYLEHAKKYQDVNRIKIAELWIPAAVICETGLPEEAKILQTEARYRLKNKKAIRIFSKPTMLKKWFENEGLDFDDYKHLMIDAGQFIPNYSLEKDNLEIFVHSPFAKRNDKEEIDRNTDSIVVQFTFQINNILTKMLLSADTPYENLIDIVNITRAHNRPEKLNWDVLKLPHHCSYQSISSEKGKEKTIPVEEAKWLINQGNELAKIISTSNSIPAENTDLPPHFQAANCYKELIKKFNGEFIVTMEFPKKEKPEPVEIEIDENGATTLKRNRGAFGIITTRSAERAG
jgi:hypothetical protein